MCSSSLHQIQVREIGLQYVVPLYTCIPIARYSSSNQGFLKIIIVKIRTISLVNYLSDLGFSKWGPSAFGWSKFNSSLATHLHFIKLI